MDTAKLTDMPKKQADRRIPLSRLFFLYVLIGLTGFGPTLASQTKKRLVENEPWLQEEDFLNGLSLAQLLPGATFVNLAVYVGYKLRGLSGAITGFCAILLMPFMLMVILSHIYFSYHSVEVVSTVFKGASVVIVGVIANAVVELGHTTVRDGGAAIVALAAAGLMFYSKNPFLVLLAAAMAGVLLYYRSLQRQEDFSVEKPFGQAKSSSCGNGWLGVLAAWSVILIIITQVLPIPILYTKLWWVFFRMGAVLFGGGLAMIPIIQQEIVDYYGWLALDEFAIGIALSQVTPGPVLILATFIGYKVAAVSGAIVATMGIFFPSLFLVMGTAEIHQKIRNNSVVRAALKGISASFIGMMLVMIVSLVQNAITDILSASIAILAFLVLRYNKLSIVMAIFSGTILYWLSIFIR